MLKFESNLARIIRHPQPASAWARQNIAELKKTIGDSWAESLIGVAGEDNQPTNTQNRQGRYDEWKDVQKSNNKRTICLALAKGCHQEFAIPYSPF